MLIDTGELLSLMRLPADWPVDVEPMHAYPSLTERITMGTGPDRRVVVVRSSTEWDHVHNMLAATETLERAGFKHMPTPIGAWGRCIVEEDVPAASALVIEPPPGSLDAAADILAELHAVKTSEGFRWGATPKELFPAEWQLFRLGFTQQERAAAETLLAQARERLLESPCGFTHGNCTAERLLLGNGKAWLVDFSFAGYGAHLSDLAAFALTSGIGPASRQAFVERYLGARGLPAEMTALYELAELTWGLDWLITLPRKMMTVHGDDAATASVRLQAGRVERGVRAGIGVDTLASAIRQALWPG